MGELEGEEIDSPVAEPAAVSAFPSSLEVAKDVADNLFNWSHVESGSGRRGL